MAQIKFKKKTVNRNSFNTKLMVFGHISGRGKWTVKIQKKGKTEKMAKNSRGKVEVVPYSWVELIPISGQSAHW